MKEIKSIEISIEERDVNDIEIDESSYSCPKCEKGIVTLGVVTTIGFPKGILASDRIGKINFKHYTCDRCDFKMLIEESCADDVWEKMNLNLPK